MSYVSHADLGGRVGFGSVVPEPEGDHFHANWEPRALALTLAMGATTLVLALADRLQRWLGERAMVAFERLMGLVLTALAVEMLLSGVRSFAGELAK